MRRYMLAAVGATAAVLMGTSTGFAQNNTLNSYGAYPTPEPYGQAPGSYVVAPSLPGAGGTYGYVQQNFGPSVGMSPNAYYSANYFTSTPMTSTNPYYYRSGYTGYQGGYGTTYSPSYANANRSYYSNYGTYSYPVRRGGGFRRWVGGMR